MLLHSKRLVMRNFQDSDLESFLSYRNVPEVAKYQGWTIPYSREKGENFIAEIKGMEAPKQGHWLQLAIELKETGEMIGDVGVRIKTDDARQAIVGFTLAPAYWHKGYASEAVCCVLEFLFGDLGLHRVTADCDVENTASVRTLERCGFRREAHFIESFLVGNEYTSEYHYGVLQREWRERKAGG